MRILVVSQMYPGPEDPDLGVFVEGLVRALRERGNDVDLAVLDRRAGGKLRYLELAGRALRARRPDVVNAHFLVPAGLIAALGVRAPLVLTAHGQDVANVGSIRGVRAATRLAVRRARAVVAVSDWLRRELEAKVPEARGKTEVLDCGVDLERFAVLPAPGEVPAFLCVGTLGERKNVVRLADAFERVGAGTLTFVGDGPLRARLEGRPGVTLAGAVPHEEVPAQLARASVLCQPSLVEPFGQALLEGLACGRPVVATRVGGPPEFVPPEAGALVDPLDVGSIAEGLRRAAALPCPSPAARASAERHGLSAQARRLEDLLRRAARGRPA